MNGNTSLKEFKVDIDPRQKLTHWLLLLGDIEQRAKSLKNKFSELDELENEKTAPE